MGEQTHCSDNGRLLRTCPSRDNVSNNESGGHHRPHTPFRADSIALIPSRSSLVNEHGYDGLGRSVRTCLVRTRNGLVPSGPIYRTDGPTTPLVALSAPCKENVSSEPFFVPATTGCDRLIWLLPRPEAISSLQSLLYAARIIGAIDERTATNRASYELLDPNQPVPRRIAFDSDSPNGFGVESSRELGMVWVARRLLLHRW